MHRTGNPVVTVRSTGSAHTLVAAIRLLVFTSAIVCASACQSTHIQNTSAKILSRVERRGNTYTYVYRPTSGTMKSLMIHPVNARDIISASGVVVAMGGGHVHISSGSLSVREIWMTSRQPPSAAKAGFSLSRVDQGVTAPCQSSWSSPLVSATTSRLLQHFPDRVQQLLPHSFFLLYRPRTADRHQFER